MHIHIYIGLANTSLLRICATPSVGHEYAPPRYFRLYGETWSALANFQLGFGGDLKRVLSSCVSSCATMLTPTFNDLLCFYFMCYPKKVSHLINHPVM